METETLDKLVTVQDELLSSISKAGIIESVQNVVTYFSELSNILSFSVYLFSALALLLILKDVVSNLMLERLLKTMQKPTKIKNKTSIIDSVDHLRRIDGQLKRALGRKNLEYLSKPLLTVLTVLFLVVSLFFLTMQQYVLVFLTPVAGLWYVDKIAKAVDYDVVDHYHLSLPNAIDVVLKTATKYEDLRSIFIHSAPSLKGIIKNDFEEIGRKMNSRDAKDVLEEFQQKYDDIWISSFVFVLLTLKSDAKREDVVKNLENLRSMLTDENKLKSLTLQEKRLTVTTNMVVAGFGIIAAIIACILPTGREFYFSTFAGVICFVGGISVAGLTFHLSVKQLANR